MNVYVINLLILAVLSQSSGSAGRPFRDVSLAAGLKRPYGRRKMYGGPAIADLDGDGWPDLLFGHHGGKHCIRVYFNNRDGTFSLSPFTLWRDLHGITPVRLLPTERQMHIIVSIGGRSGRKLNRPQMFWVLNNRAIFEVTGQSPSFADSRIRGRTAVVLSMRLQQKGVTRPDVLLLNVDDQWGKRHQAFSVNVRGQLESRMLNPKKLREAKNQYGGVTDIDGDGVMELVLLDQLTIWKLYADYYYRDETNNVLPRSADRSHFFGVMSFAELDYDNDGRWDLYLARTGTGQLQWRGGWISHDLLLRNVGGRYADVTHGAGVPVKLGRAASSGVTVADFDNDGHIDILVERFTHDPAYVLLRNRGNGKFEQVSPGFKRARSIDGDSVAAVDYDRDGRVDVIASEGSWGKNPRRLGNYRILKNTWVTGNGFLLVRVKSAPGYKATSVNAVVYVRSHNSKRVMMRRVGSPGTVVSNSYVELVHFGLGRRAQADVVTVRWTDGTTRTKWAVKVNSTIEFGV